MGIIPARAPPKDEPAAINTVSTDIADVLGMLEEVKACIAADDKDGALKKINDINIRLRMAQSTLGRVTP